MTPGNGDVPDVPPPAPPKAVIQIILTANGSIALNAPVADKLLCLGMLEIAKEMVLENYRGKLKPGNGGIIPIRSVQ